MSTMEVFGRVVTVVLFSVTMATGLAQEKDAPSKGPSEPPGKTPQGPTPAKPTTDAGAEPPAPSGDPVTRLDEVVVKAHSPTGEEERLSSPVPQATTTRKEFAPRTNPRMGDVIQRLPGLYLEGPPGINQDLRLRGLDKEFGRMQLDGVQLPGGGEKREFNMNQIPSFLIESATIIRNPTAEYESDGLAGRLDLRSRPIPTKTTFEGLLGYGGHDALDGTALRGSAAFGGRPVKWFGAMGAFEHSDDTFQREKFKLFSTGKSESESEKERLLSDNLHLDLGFFYPNGEFHIKPLSLSLDKNKDKTKITLDPSKPPASDETREIEEENFLQRTWGLGLKHEHAFKSGAVWETLAGYYLTGEDKDKDKLAFKEGASKLALDKTTLEQEDKEDKTWNLSSALTVPFELGLRQELKFGVALRLRDRFRDKFIQEINKAGQIKDVTGPKEDYSLTENYTAGFVQDEIWLTDKFSVLPGVRLEHVSLDVYASDGTTANRGITDVNPSVHLLYRATEDLSLKAAISRAVNRPKFDELSPFEDEKPNRITIGNPNLDPARAWNLDVGAEYATKHVFLGANVFQKWIVGVIEEVDTGIDKNGKDIFQVENAGDGWTRGLELEEKLNLGFLKIKPLQGFTVWANQTLLDSQLKEKKTGRKRRFQDQPEFIGNLGLDYEIEPCGTTLSLAWNYIGKRDQFKPDGTVRTRQSSSTLDLAVRQRVHKNFKVFLEAQNLTDDKVREFEQRAGRTTNHSTQSFGRTFLVGLQWEF